MVSGLDPSPPSGASHAEYFGEAVGESRTHVVWLIQGAGLVAVTFLSFFPGFSHFTEYLFFSLLVLAMVALGLERSFVRIRTLLDLPLLLFVGWVLLTVPFAIDPTYSFSEWRKLAAKALAFYWAVVVLRTQTNGAVLRGVLLAVVAGTAAMGVYAIGDFVEHGATWRERDARAAAPASDYNWLSTYMVITIPLVAAMGVLSKRRWPQVAYAGVFVLALLAELFSYTRAGWLGVAAEALSVGIFVRSRKLIVWALGSCLLLGAGLFVVYQAGYQYNLIHSETSGARLALWKLGMSDVLAHPLVGVGYGNDTFMKRFADYPETKKPGGSHNTFLMVTMGSGIPALGFLLWTLARTVRLCLPESNRLPDNDKEIIKLATAVMIIGFSVRNFFDYMFAGSLAYLFWIMLATSLSQDISSQASSKQNNDFQGRNLLS
jgi:heptosyltransferase-3/putative inorganic carbon (HCO3(-)) transporter